MTVGGSSKDLSYCEIKPLDFNHEGYYPYIAGICGGDDIGLTICVSCGQVQGTWPKEDEVRDAVQEHLSDDDDEDERQAQMETETRRSQINDLMDRSCYLNPELFDMDKITEADSNGDVDMDITFLKWPIQTWFIQENITPTLDMNRGALGTLIFETPDQQEKFTQAWKKLI
jgi:hypothetical protein